MIYFENNKIDWKVTTKNNSQFTGKIERWAQYPDTLVLETEYGKINIPHDDITRIAPMNYIVILRQRFYYPDPDSDNGRILEDDSLFCEVETIRPINKFGENMLPIENAYDYDDMMPRLSSYEYDAIEICGETYAKVYYSQRQSYYDDNHNLKSEDEYQYFALMNESQAKSFFAKYYKGFVEWNFRQLKN